MNVNGLNSISNLTLHKIIPAKNDKGREGFSLNFSQKSSSQGGIHLFIDGISSCGTADGTNVTVYQSDSYSSDNPELKIVTIYPDGSKIENMVDPRNIDPSNATEIEMLALHSYLVMEGKTDIDISHTGIVSGTGISETKTDYMKVMNKLMMMQYNAHNLKGYMEYGKILGVYHSFLDSKKC